MSTNTKNVSLLKLKNDGLSCLLQVDAWEDWQTIGMVYMPDFPEEIAEALSVDGEVVVKVYFEIHDWK